MFPFLLQTLLATHGDQAPHLSPQCPSGLALAHLSILFHHYCL